MNKRGVSDIIMTVIMVVLVLTAVGVVWVVVQNILDEGLSDVSLGSIKINLDIENVKVTDAGVDVKVKRNSGEANLVGINFIVSDGENTEVFEEETDMKELATQTFTLDYDGFPDSVEIAPVLANDKGKEKVYDSVDVYENSVRKDLEKLGIVSWWSLNGDADDEFSINDGEVIGNTNCNIEGVYGRACDFDGDGDYIEIADSPSIDMSDNMTVSFWMKADNSVFWERLINKNPSDSDSSGWEITKDSNYDSIIIRLDTSVGPNQNRRIVTSVYDNNWHNIVVVVEHGNVSGYRDGVLNSSLTYNHGNGFANIVKQDLHFGFGAFSNYFQGSMDEIMIFNQALTDEQVKGLYNLDLS